MEPRETHAQRSTQELFAGAARRQEPKKTQDLSQEEAETEVQEQKRPLDRRVG